MTTKCSVCDKEAVYRVTCMDGTVVYLCAEHKKSWVGATYYTTLKRRARNIRCLASFVILLILTVFFAGYLVFSPKPSRLVSGVYCSVKPIAHQFPEPNEYIVLNSTYKSELNEDDLVSVLESYDQITQDMKKGYEAGKIPEIDYKSFLQYGSSGRLTDKVEEMFTSTTKYVLWQHQNRWFNITGVYNIDVYNRGSTIQQKAVFATGLVVGWVALVIYAVKTRKEEGKNA